MSADGVWRAVKCGGAVRRVSRGKGARCRFVTDSRDMICSVQCDDCETFAGFTGRFFMSDPIFAIIPAGGVGARALTGDRQIPKQYCPINGIPMLQLAVQALQRDPRVTAVHIGVTAEDAWIETLEFSDGVHIHRTAGATRALTVSATLEAALDLHGDQGWALVHDAARPGLQPESLTALIDACLQQNKGGLLALPVPDTVKRAQVDEQQQVCVGQTVSREGLWLAQTPQLFPAKALLQALTEALREGLEITDEASAMEAAGCRPLLISGTAHNMKVTWPADFAMVEKWL